MTASRLVPTYRRPAVVIPPFAAEAGERLEAMLAMGSSQPWPDALEALTGQREMDATAILDDFAPFKIWLDEQNEGRTCGW